MVPNKVDIFRALLLRGSVFVHFNPKKDGVRLPHHLKSKDQIVLQFGLDMPIPIPDLGQNMTEVRGTLAFDGVPFFCVVPWHAVYALVGEDAKGYVWKEHMPSPLLAEIKAEERRKSFSVIQGGKSTSKNPSTSKSSTRLRSV